MIPAWRISPTKMEALRRYDFFDEDDYRHLGDEEMQKRIIGIVEPTEAMKIGSAIHKALETSSTWQESGNWVIRFEKRDDLGDLAAHGRPLREHPLSLTVGAFRFAGVIDVWLPRLVIDYKTSTRAADSTQLASSWQWRCYCLMAKVKRFVFRHYQYSKARVNAKGSVAITCKPPSDLDLYLDVDQKWLQDQAERLVDVAVSLNCSGALRQDRYPIIKNLIECNKHSLVKTGKPLPSGLLQCLWRNDLDRDELQVETERVRGAMRPIGTFAPATVAFDQLEALL